MRQSEVPVREGAGDGKVLLNQERLKAMRKQRGLSQDALAQLCLKSRLCVSIASIKRAETGKPVLYRTASHLARVYQTELDELIGAPGSGAAPAPRCAYQEHAEHAEQRKVLALTLLLAEPLPGALAAQAAELMTQFGGLHDEGGPALFGLPRAYGSDAVRCLQCALALAQLLRGRRCALVIRARAWPAAAAAVRDQSASPTLLRAGGAAPGLPPVYVERAQAIELSERCVFAPSPHGGDLLRFTHERQGLLAAQYPLIGRYVEVQQFKAILETTLAYQCGHILYLRGVAGIGKSRLIQECIDIASHSDLACHTAVVLDFGVRGDATPLGQLVRSLLGLAPGAAPSEARLAERLRHARLPEELIMPLRAILGMPQPVDAGVVFGAMSHQARALRQLDAIRELILQRSVERPLLLVIEDLHWSSPELLATLASLLPEVQDAPIIWMLSSRFEQDPFETSLRPYLGGWPLTMRDLITLRPAEALAIARHAGEPDPAFHQQCVARAQGNPLFLTQLLLAGPGQALPGSLQNLVQSKLDLLAAPQRRAIRVASAIGQYFSLAFLRAVLGQPEHDLLDCSRQYIVRATDRDNFVFVHDLVMQGIYESMPPAQRDETHLALARAYENGDSHLRAQHLHKARHADAPAALVAVIVERIADFQYAAALELIGQCQRIGYAPPDLYRLQLLAGRCHAKMGQTQEAKLAFTGALALALDQTERVAAVIGLATALNVLEDLALEETLLDDTIGATLAAGIEEGLAELYYLKGNIYFPAGNFAEGRRLHELSQRYARSGDTEARALSGIGDSYYAQGRIVTAHGYFRACLALCEEHGLPEIEASNRFMLGTARLYLNQTDGALDDALASAELGRRVGNRRAEIVSRLTAGWALLSLGRAAEARAQVEQGLAIARNIGASRFEPFLTESLVRVLLLEGKVDEAHAQASLAWDMVQRNKLQKFIGPWVLSTLALVEPNAQARAAALEQGQALLDQGCVAHNALRYYVSAMECALVGQRPDAVRALIGRFAIGTADEPAPWSNHHMAMAGAGADWLESGSAPHLAALREQMRKGQASGLGWVMPLWRLRMEPVLGPD